MRLFVLVFLLLSTMASPFRSILSLFSCLGALAPSLAVEPQALTIERAEIRQRTEVRFPATMRVSGVKTGQVTLALSIDETGQVDDTFIVSSTRRAFARAALKSIEHWSFSPALYNGEPFPSTLQLDLDFELGRDLGWQTFQAPVQTNITRSAQQEKPIISRSIAELDSIPLPLRIVEPAGEISGEATVEFYIDELGKVRCPRLVAGDDLVFGRAMLDAVARWRFQPPIADGSKTNTFVRQTFLSVEGKLVSGDAF